MAAPAAPSPIRRSYPARRSASTRRPISIPAIRKSATTGNSRGTSPAFWNRVGRHETKAGYEFYRSQRIGGGSQSSTDYVFWSDYAKGSDGRPLRDSAGRLIPTFVPGESGVEYYPATTRGATLNNDSHSVFVHDHWSLHERWSLDLGARLERVRAVSSGDIVSVQNIRIVPRLGATHDIQGNGRHILHVTYGQYSGRYNEAQIGGNSPVGNAPLIFTAYQGPAGQGLDFAPGFNTANYPLRLMRPSPSRQRMSSWRRT